MKTRAIAGACICLAALTALHCRRDDAAAASTLAVLYDGDELRWPRSIAFLELALPDEHGRMQGRLARSWEHSPDYRTWTYYLRTDVQWHDGVPVTAHDVKFAMDLFSHPDVLYRRPGSYATSVRDDSTVVVTYSRGSLRTQPETGTVCLPKHLLQHLNPADFESWDFWKRPVGNGPFRYVRHVPKTFVEFERNPEYVLGRPKVQRLIVRFGPPSVTELLGGTVDAVSHFRRADVIAVKDDPRLRVYYEIWDDVQYFEVIFWNHRHPFLTDARVRRALTLAIDRRELLRALDMWQDLPILDGVYTERQYWQGHLPAALPYDPDQARGLLDRAGWRDIDGDGVRERDDRQLSFALLVTPPWQAAAVYVQAQLRQLGVRADISSVEGAVARARVRAGQFDAAVGTLASRVDDLRQVFGEASPTGYRNARFLQLLHAAQNAANADEIDGIFRDLSGVVAEDLPFTFLVLNVETYVAHRRVKGLSTPFRANPLASAEHVWLEDER